MKKMVILALVVFLPLMGWAQFKSQAKLPNISQVIASDAAHSMFSLFDPTRFSMHHSLSMSYMTIGGRGMMVNSYMNTMEFRLGNPLFLRVNLGVMNTPFNSFNNPALNGTRFFGGAELDYRPTRNSLIKVGVNIGPDMYYYSPLYSPYRNYRFGDYGNSWSW